MFKVGITGGIGSGKTTTSRLFEDRGIPVFYTDTVARELEKRKDVQEAFTKILGVDVFVDGVMDREKMRSLVFTNDDIRSQINHMIGPYIMQAYKDFVDEHEKKGTEMVMLESAIIFEVGMETMFDFVITIVLDKETRIKRVMNRDKITRDAVLLKMASQWPDKDKAAKSDFVIFFEEGEGVEDYQFVERQVDKIVGWMKKLKK